MNSLWPQFTGLDLELQAATKDQLYSENKLAREVIRFTSADVSDAPEELDVRRWHRLEDQGNQGSCQGQANTSVAEGTHYVCSGGKADSQGKSIQFSRQFCYLATQKIDGLLGRDVGSTIMGGVRMAKEGHVLESLLPYPNGYDSRIPEECWKSENRKWKINRGLIAESYDDIWLHQAGRMGFHLLGMIWPDCMQQQQVIETFSLGGRGAGRHAGGHAVALMGWSSKKDSRGRNYIRLCNSWGVGRWSPDGTKLVSPTALEQILGHKWTVCVGFMGISGAEPQGWDFLKNSFM